MASDKIRSTLGSRDRYFERRGVKIDCKRVRGRKRESRRMPPLCQAFGDATFRAGTKLQQSSKSRCARVEAIGDRTIDFQV